VICTAILVRGILSLVSWGCILATAQVSGASDRKMTLDNLKSIERLSSAPLTNPRDAEEYVTQVVSISGAWPPDQVSDVMLRRLASGELATARDSQNAVPDKAVAAAFALLSTEFGVKHAKRLNAAQIYRYRILLAAIFPNLFGRNLANGSRPMGAAALLYLLVLEGGIPKGAWDFDEQHIPRKLVIRSELSRLKPFTPTQTELEYQSAYREYFSKDKSSRIPTLFDELMQILQLP
jgi:hypothetical protein